MIIRAPVPRSRLGVGAAAAFLLACFAVGVFAVRSTTPGIMLIGVLLCVAVYLARPQLMVGIALFAACGSLPEALHVGKTIGPVTVYVHQVAVLVAIAFLLTRVRLQPSALLVPTVLLSAVGYGVLSGVAAGNDVDRVGYEALFLGEMLAGFMLAMLVAAADRESLSLVREAMTAMAAVLWFSAGMIVASSLTGFALSGRAETVRGDGFEAVRILTPTQIPAMVVIVALVAAHILHKVPLRWFVALGAPALVISLLSFSRSIIIGVAVAAVVAALCSGKLFPMVRRAAVLTVASALALVAVAPLAIFLLRGTAAGGWLGSQTSAFAHRVLDGVSAGALARDSSTHARLVEVDNLLAAATQAPLLGQGLGFAYQLPFGPAGSFTATLGTTYAHNFYLWWLVKAGVVGMIAFAVFALVPVVRALRSVSVWAKTAAAVATGLLAVCVVDPLPLQPVNSLVLGMALGAAAGLAGGGGRSRAAAPAVFPAAQHAGSR